MICGFIGKMGCLKKGTLVKTIDGLETIEKVDSVLSYAPDGDIVSMPAFVIPSMKKPITITFDDDSQVVCSNEHYFLTERGYIKAKDIKIDTRILYFDENRPIRKQKRHVVKTRREKNSESISNRNEHYRTEKNTQLLSNSNNLSIKKEQCENQALEGTNSNRKNKTIILGQTQGRSIEREKQSFLQAWKNGGPEIQQKRILVDSESASPVGMYYMQQEINKQKIRLSSTSQGRKQHSQLSEELGYPVPIMSHKSTLRKKRVQNINKEPKDAIQMYDLVVPNTNNYLLANGVITHNSGKTLSMTRELYKYHKQGHKIITNYGVSFPHDRINFEELYANAEEQTDMNNLVIALDEVHIVLDSRSGMSGVNKVITFWLNQTRKMGVKLFYTTQYLHQIDKRLRSGTDIFVFTNGMKVIKDDGREFFVVQNDITDGDNSKKEIFIGNDYYKLYDTNEVVNFINKEDVAEKQNNKKKKKDKTKVQSGEPPMNAIVESKYNLKDMPSSKQVEEWF